MSYANSIPDILPRSTWIGPDGTRASVISAAARHVTFTRVSPIVQRPLLTLPETLHERDFRARFFPIYDRAAIRSQFTMSLANLGEFRVYWLPARRRIMARSISCTRQFRVPPGAELVGVYSNPFKTEAFFDDLDDVIRRIESAHVPARDQRESA